MNSDIFLDKIQTTPSLIFLNLFFKLFSHTFAMLKESFIGTLTAVKKRSKTILPSNFISFGGQRRSSHRINSG